jgi:hypothetical protein
MIAQINQLIDLNLLLLTNTPTGVLQLSDFKNHLGIKLQDATILADIMQRKDLIRLQPEKEFGYVLTDFGKQICDCGGWLLYLENLKKENNNIEFNEPKIEPDKHTRNSDLINRLKPILSFFSRNNHKSEI